MRLKVAAGGRAEGPRLRGAAAACGSGPAPRRGPARDRSREVGGHPRANSKSGVEADGGQGGGGTRGERAEGGGAVGVVGAANEAERGGAQRRPHRRDVAG